MKEIISIFRYKLVGLNLLLILLSGILMFLNDHFVPIFFILTSNIYDILGYHFTLIRRTKIIPDKVIVRSYRITQLMFDLTLLILLAVLFNPVISLSAAVLKLFGLQDLLYYLFLKIKLPAEWTWLRWTPFGIFKEKLSKKTVLMQVSVGIVVATFILIIAK